VPLFDFLDDYPRRASLAPNAALGLALGFYPGPPFLVPALAASALTASFGLALGSLEARAAQARRARALALALGLFAGAVAAVCEAGQSAPASGAAGAESAGVHALQPAWAEGRLVSDSTTAKGNFRSYQIEVERLGLEGPAARAELSYPGRGRCLHLRVLAMGGPDLDTGALIRAAGSVAVPEGSNALAEIKGDGAALFARSRDLAVVDEGGALDRLRARIRSALRRGLARIGRDSGGLLQALILGARDSLAPDEAEAFKKAGCAHVLALSGQHLSVLALIAIVALKSFAGPWRARLAGALLSTIFMWIVGPGPSLLRAVLMAWIAALALALDRPQDWITILSLSFIATLPLDLAAARSLSFTLSYLAVLGLATLGPRFSFFLGGLLPPCLRSPASAALAAQAAVSPLLAFTYGYLQLAGAPASALAAPLVSVFMYWGLGAGILCSIFPAAQGLAVRISDFLYRLIMGLMRTAASVPVLALGTNREQEAATIVVVCIVALVYARPYAEYRASLRGRAKTRLRLAPGPKNPARGRRPRDEQALRPELPRA
jgi:competence protein ComEC